jgi:hypothetical protein
MTLRVPLEQSQIAAADDIRRTLPYWEMRHLLNGSLKR